MRRSLLVGVVLAVAACVVVALSGMYDLELDSTVLLGVTLGATIGLVPDRTPAARVVGFLGGFAAAWMGYLARAGALPDTNTGRAVAVGLTVLLCTLAVVVTAGRAPLWATLLGASAMAGAFEYTYAAAPTEVLSTSLSTATSVLVSVALGVFLVAFLVPRPTRPPASAPTHADDQMEMTR